MNHTRLTARLAIFGLASMGALSWVPCSHSQMPQAITVPAATAHAATPTSGRAQTGLKAAFGQLPFRFEENRSQTDGGVQFLSRGDGYMLFLTQSEAVLALRRSHHPEGNKPSSSDLQSGSAVLRLRLAGVNTLAQGLGIEELPGKSNYFIGNNPKTWRTNVRTYAKIRYNDVYPGVDLVYYGNQSGQLEFDFVVAPGADPKAITLNVEQELAASKRAPHAAPLRLDPNGDLMLHGGGGDVRFQKPVVYQQDGQGRRHYIDGYYLLHTAKSGIEDPKSEVSFEVAAYNHEKPLIIDPAVAYSTFLNGTTDQSSSAGIASFTDPVTGHVYAYVAGYTCSSDFPTANAEQPTYGGPCDAFVAKFDPSVSGASSLIYSTYLGGSGGDSANGIAVDSAGNAYVTGWTSSANFPLTSSAYQTTNKAFPNSNAFLAKLSPDGHALLYSTYFGGSGQGGSFPSGPFGDAAYAIALDATGRAYVVGFTSSTDFPTANPYQATFRNGGASSAFVAILDATQSGPASLWYSTYLGGSGSGNLFGNIAYAVAVDTSGAVHLGGVSGSADFPLVNAFQTTPPASGSFVAFYAKLNPSASGAAQLIYSTFLGDGSAATGVAVDAAGYAYLTGYTGVFPTTAGAYRTAPSANPFYPGDAFAAKINPAAGGSLSLVYSTYLGVELAGSSRNLRSGIAVDTVGNAFVMGSSVPGLALVNPVMGSSNGIFQSADAGQSWVVLGSQGLWALPAMNQDISTTGFSGFPALAIDTSTSPSTLYAGTYFGNILKSADGGLNWNLNFTIPGASKNDSRECGGDDELSGRLTALAVDPTNPSNVYAGTCVSGVYKSSDGGNTWSTINSGLSSTALLNVTVLFFDAGTLYAGADDGVYILRPGATSWTATSSGQPVGSIAIDPTTNPHTIYTGTTSAGSYYAFRSTDGGATWTSIGYGAALAVDTSTSPPTLYNYDFHDGNFGHSTDGGNTWTWVGLPGFGVFNCGCTPATQAVVIDPATKPSTLYIQDSDRGVWKSVDGGNTWRLVLPGTISAIALNSKNANATNPAILYAGTASTFSAGVSNYNIFVAELNPSGSSLLFSTYLGSVGTISLGSAIALDAADNIYVVGTATLPSGNNDDLTGELSFPTLNAYQASAGRATIQTATFAKLGSQALPMTSSTSVSSQVGVQTGTLTVTLPDITGSTTSSEPTLTVTPLSSAATANFSLSNNLGAYDISTTATYSASTSSPITLCFQALTVNDLTTFNGLRLIHIVNGTPLDSTFSRDFTTRTVCGSATSLSPFILINGTPTVTWGSPQSIIYGTPLSGTQLNATASVPGTFTYSPTAGTVIGPGQQTLSVTFTPSNPALYSSMTKTTNINVMYSTASCNGDLGHSVLQPINTDGTSVFKLGSTVPTKFRVCDTNGVSVGLPGTVVSYGLTAAGVVSGLTVDEAAYSTSSDSAFRWDSTGKEWIFNQATGKNNPTLSQTNTIYSFRISLRDGSTIQFQYGLK